MIAWFVMWLRVNSVDLVFFIFYLFSVGGLILALCNVISLLAVVVVFGCLALLVGWVLLLLFWFAVFGMAGLGGVGVCGFV